MKTSFTIFTISLLLAVIIDGAADYVHETYYISTVGVRTALLAFLIPVITVSATITIYKLIKKAL